ncbi:hypothetical protein PR048_005096 [Dryococelus australis]|uniref:Uncharacterized protein n=1 Tax=Dryococelus australis TaxID=614101 RepID=A0ABQ9I782_9NEOP|nr:hypothetical protein PR048_005096 [Dryococelus australis]
MECTYGKTKPLKNEMLQRAFETKNVPLFNMAIVEDVVVAAIIEIIHKEEEYMSKESGWTLTVLPINKLELLCASSYIAQPAQIAAKMETISHKNLDQQCLKWSILA